MSIQNKLSISLRCCLVAAVCVGVGACNREPTQVLGENPPPEESVKPSSAEEGTDARIVSDGSESIEEKTLASTPEMAEARYAELEFGEGSNELTDDARDELSRLAEDIPSDTDVYLTVRVEDHDTVEATEPEEYMEKLTQPRVQTITAFLTRQGVTVVDVGIDRSGEVANAGEGGAMVQPQPGEPTENTQIMVVTITESGGPLINPL